MIHAKQWHYSLHRDFQQLHSIHSTRRNPWDSSSTNSTFRRQRALRVILHAEGKEIFYPVYKDLQGIPVLQGHSRHSSHSWHYSPTGITTRSSTFQYNPVQSSTFQCYPVYPGIPPVPAFLQSECKFYTPIGFHQKLHWVPVECKTLTFKEREMLRYRSNVDIFYRIELIPPSALSSRVTNCYNDIHKFLQQFEWSRVNRDIN